jgi:hypothetical protein
VDAGLRVTVIQRGQALVAVMVVMLILFALAGAVAIGASTLLTRRGESAAVANDFQVRSAVNDSVALLAGSTKRCGAPPPLPSPSPTAMPTPVPSPLGLTLPDRNLPGGIHPTALCAREDLVTSGTVQRIAVGPGAGCTSVDLNVAGNGRLAVLFDARSKGGWAFITDETGATACTTSIPGGGHAPCSQAFSPGVGTVGQVALTCDFTSGRPVSLRVHLDAWPGLVFTATQDPAGTDTTTGSVYLLASGTGLSRPDYEESVLFVRGDGRVSQLLHEAPLP